MQGISASAFSLEAFYASVDERILPDEELAKRWAKNRTARAVRISETLIRAFKITHTGRAVLRKNLEEVFKFRDYAVHPPARFRKPITHPELGVGVEWRFFAFTASRSITTTRVALSIIKQCMHAPQSKHEELAKWSEVSVARLMKWSLNGKGGMVHYFDVPGAEKSLSTGDEVQVCPDCA